MMKEKENRMLNFMFWGMFVLYLFLMLYVVFLRSGLNNRSINLIPFQSILEGINVYDGIRYRLVDMQIWGNVLMFIPTGVYLMIFAKEDSKYKAFLSILVISIAIEIIQYIFATGVSDIDDVILNCFGGAIGIFIYLILKKVFKTKDKTKKIISWISTIIGIPILIIAILVFYVN